MAASMSEKIWRAKFHLNTPDNRVCNIYEIAVGIKEYSYLAGSIDNSRCYVAISRNLSFNHCTFSCVRVMNQLKSNMCPGLGTNSTHSDCDTYCDGNTFSFTLHCSEEFLKHYRFRTDQVVFLKPVIVFPLTKVLIGTKSLDAYLCAKTKLNSTDMLLAVCQNKILIQNYDNFLLNVLFLSENDEINQFSQDLQVLDCEPLSCGILSVSTNIVLLNMTNQNENQDMVTLPSNSEVFETVLLSDFCDPIKSRLSLDSYLNKCKEYLQFNILPSIYVTTLESRKECETIVLDIHNCILMSKSYSASLGLYHGSFVEIQLLAKDNNSTSTNCGKLTQNHSSAFQLNGISVINQHKHFEMKSTHSKQKSRQKRRTVQICIFDPMPEALQDFQENVYVSDILYFNMDVNKKQLNTNTFFYQKLTSSEEETSSSSWTSELQFASEVHVACVHSPNYSDGINPGNMLEEYFAKPRFLQKGDIFSICITDESDLCQNLTDGIESRQPVIYFKVIKMLPRSTAQTTLLVDSIHTTLFQVGAVHSYVPVHETQSACHMAASPGILATYVEKLVELVLPHLENREGSEDLYPSILLTGPPGCGKSTVTKTAAARLHMHLFQINCHDLCGESAGATETRIKHVLQRACTFAPCLLMLRNVHSLGKDRDGNSEDPRIASNFHEQLRKLKKDSLSWPIVVIATTESSTMMTSGMSEGFLHHVQIEAPVEESRLQMISDLCRQISCSTGINNRYLAQRTAGFVLGDLNALMHRAKKIAVTRAAEVCCTSGMKLSVEEESDICLAGVKVQQTDFEKALDQMQGAHCDVIGAPKIPSVSWEDVGGLGEVKAEILDTIQLPLQHPELFTAGLRRSGVLLYGPPGTGKTLLAKAVATECSLNFLSVKGPELLNMYVGQSEENIREVFTRARSASPCVIFFDELDSLAPNRGRSGDSGGVMDRIVSQLLAELDGLHKSCDVFVIGATNRPDLLDPALLRPGRFDKLLFLGVSEDRESQLKIIKALTRKFSLAEDCSLEEVVKNCPFNMTGADFYALCSDTMLNAVKRMIDLLEAGVVVNHDEIEVGLKDFTLALSKLVPSVSEREIRHYKSLKDYFAKHG